MSDVLFAQFWSDGDKIFDAKDLSEERVEYLLWRAGFKPVSD